ncbi:MAG: hypothetical protein ABSH52_25655 [Terriglobia bacterium]
MNRFRVLAVASLALLLGMAQPLCAPDFEALAKEGAQKLAGRQYDNADYENRSHVAEGTLDDIANCVAAQRTQ